MGGGIPKSVPNMRIPGDVLILKPHNHGHGHAALGAEDAQNMFKRVGGLRGHVLVTIQQIPATLT